MTDESARPAGGRGDPVCSPQERTDDLPAAPLYTREQRLAFLVSVGDLLGSSLSYKKTLRDLADLMVPRFADWCAVDIADEHGVLERLAAAHVDPEKRKIARELDQRYPRLQGPQGATAVFRSGKAQWAQSIPDTWLVEGSSDDEQLTMLRRLGLRSYVSVPLAARGTVLGVLTLVTAESGRIYDEEDLTFARAIASRAGVAIDNARLFEAAQSELQERRRAEQYATEREDDARQRLSEIQALMDLVPVGIAVARDSAGEDIAVNAAAAGMLGIDPARNASKSSADAQSLPFRVLRNGREVPPEDLPLQWALANDTPVRGEEFEVVRDDGSAVTLLESAMPLRDGTGAVRGCVGVFTDITERRQGERLLEIRTRQLEAIAAIVRPGLAGEPLQTLLDTAVQHIAWALDVELCDVLQLQPDRDTLLLKAGIGWRAGLVGEGTVSAGPGTQAGYTLAADEPWVTREEASTNVRFPGDGLLEHHGVVSGASVRIGADGDDHYGVLGVHTTQPRRFSEEECRFLQSAADTLANLLRGRRAIKAAKESRDQLDFTLDATNLGTWEWNVDTGEVAWTEGLMRIHGREPGAFTGTVDSAFSDAHPEDRELVRRAVADALENDTPYRVEYRIIVGAEQEIRWVETRGRVVRGAGGRPRKFHGVCMDVTEQKRHGEALRESEERFRLIAENAVDLIFLTDLDRRLVYVSPSFKRVLGYEPDDLQGRRLLDLIHPDDHAGFSVWPAESLCDFRARCKDGEYLWMEGTSYGIRSDASYVVGAARDITARKQLEHELQHAASHDPLTGVPNRALFLDRLQHLLERGARESVDYAVLLLDLDDFKQINDSLGHLAGDALLIQFTERVRRCLRPGDTFARLGGDEFVLLLEEEGGEAGVNAVAERILEQTGRPFRIEGHSVEVGVSIGATLGIGECRRPQDVLRRADVALYEAKNEGKGRLRR